MKNKVKEQVSTLVQSIYKKTDDINKVIDKIMEIVEGDPTTEADYLTPATPDPVRLWCAKDGVYGGKTNAFCRGDILNFISGEAVKYRNGIVGRPHCVLQYYLSNLGSWHDSIFPLTKRTAKEGEWARNIKTGEVVKVIAGAKQDKDDGIAYAGKDGCLHYMPNAEYEVIENYQGEHEPKPEEPKPERLNGSVVCLDKFDKCVMRQHKKYVFKNGIVTLESGRNSCTYKSIDEWNRMNPGIKIARLIED